MTMTQASPKQTRRERMYREYMEFFENGERTRRWNLFNDIPWDWLESPRISPDIREGRGVAAEEDVAICLETFCSVELFIPDYTRSGLCMSRDIFGQSWFHLAWGYEESKHAMAFRQYLTRSGLRSVDQYMAFEERILTHVWQQPFQTYRQMVCYGALQEAATFLIYLRQREKHSKATNPVLNQIFNLIARDEAAHTSFYRRFLKFELEEDREGTLIDLSHVIHHFEMPGKQVVPDYAERMGTQGVGVTSQDFLINGIIPTLKHLGVSRSQLVKASLSRQKTEEEQPHC
jgi:acyl-[acyl-carrier-protein] desaturase